MVSYGDMIHVRTSTGDVHHCKHPTTIREKVIPIYVMSILAARYPLATDQCVAQVHQMQIRVLHISHGGCGAARTLMETMVHGYLFTYLEK